MLSKEARKELEAYKLELKKKEDEYKHLISHNMDFAFLQEFINKCNDNPGLSVKITLKDGTVIDMVAQKEQKREFPLFTAAAYEE